MPIWVLTSHAQNGEVIGIFQLGIVGFAILLHFFSFCDFSNIRTTLINSYLFDSLFWLKCVDLDYCSSVDICFPLVPLPERLQPLCHNLHNETRYRASVTNQHQSKCRGEIFYRQNWNCCSVFLGWRISGPSSIIWRRVALFGLLHNDSFYIRRYDARRSSSFPARFNVLRVEAVPIQRFSQNRHMFSLSRMKSKSNGDTTLSTYIAAASMTL